MNVYQELNDILIPHTAFTNAQGQIEKSLLSTGDQYGHVALLGEYCTGKTRLLQDLQSKHAPMDGDQGTEASVLLVTMPPDATVKNVLQQMLAALRAPDIGKSTRAASADLVENMRRARTRLLMLDDCQHLSDSGTKRHLSEWLIDLASQTETRLVLAGFPSCNNLIAQNEHFATRFGVRIVLERFSWDDDNQRREFTAILKSFDYEINERLGMSFLDSLETAFYINSASGGLIGNAVRLVRCAIANAMAQSRSAVSMNDFDAARAQFIEPKPKRARFHERARQSLQSPLRLDSKHIEQPSKIAQLNDEGQIVNALLLPPWNNRPRRQMRVRSGNITPVTTGQSMEDKC